MVDRHSRKCPEAVHKYLLDLHCSLNGELVTMGEINWNKYSRIGMTITRSSSFLELSWPWGNWKGDPWCFYRRLWKDVHPWVVGEALECHFPAGSPSLLLALNHIFWNGPLATQTSLHKNASGVCSTVLSSLQSLCGWSRVWEGTLCSWTRQLWVMIIPQSPLGVVTMLQRNPPVHLVAFLAQPASVSPDYTIYL